MTKNVRRSKPPNFTKTVSIVVGLVLIAAITVLLVQFKDDHSGGVTPTEINRSNDFADVDTGVAVEAMKLEPNSAMTQLQGRWLREDGGYILEIREVASDGRLTAAYFNPNPIHVSNAAVVEEAGALKVGIELNDINYPGCLYTLVFDPELDQLIGSYYQAALGQTFEVVFVRMSVQ